MPTTIGCLANKPLERYAQMFDQLDTRVSAWSKPMRERLGLTDEILQASLEQILAGEPDDPLPDKQTVRDLKRKLGRRQRLIRVWEFSLEDGTRPLIFELADGSLWQLSDVGLGSTRFRTTGAGWTEHPAVKPYLPAEILPRPEHTAPWDYEFTLSKGAVRRGSETVPPNSTFDRTAGSHSLAAAGQGAR